MSDPRASARGRFEDAGDPMSLTIDPDLEPAVAEAKLWAARLQRAAHRGVGDRDKTARAIVARQTGVPESYLLRLHKRAREMTDVSGKYARLLRLACEKLDRAAQRADRHREEAELELHEIHDALAGGRGETRESRRPVAGGKTSGATYYSRDAQSRAAGGEVDGLP